MSLTKEAKQKLIAEFATAKGDTGSPEVQIAVLTAQISALAEHMKTHAKDFHSRRGLNSMVTKRRQLLAYVKKQDNARYEALIQRLKLRK